MKSLMIHIFEVVPYWLIALLYGLTGALVVSFVEGGNEIFVLLSEGILLLYLLFFQKKFLIYFLFLIVPVSVTMPVGGGSTIVFPSEILSVILTMTVILGVMLLPIRGNRFFYHPVTLLILLEILWMVVASAFSMQPEVSFKRVMVRVCYVGAFYFLAGNLFSERRRIPLAFWLYAAGMLVPVISSVVFHARFSFSTTAAYMMTLPFFKDHTIYGAALAFIVVMTGCFLYFQKSVPIRFSTRFWAVGLVLVLLVALFLSYSRAAWISVVVAAGFYGLLRLRVSFTVVMLLALALGTVVFFQRDRILKRLEKTEAESNKGDFANHFQSVGNLQTDASNKERINRWICAYKMFLDRPLIGFGPGTYQFYYGRFQSRIYMTRISTFAGNRGHAHSEYLGPLAETGLPGFLIVVLLFGTVIRTGMNLIYNSNDKFIKHVAIACTLSLITFYVHGLFNGFLDSDEIAILVFSATAAIVQLDIVERKTQGSKK